MCLLLLAGFASSAYGQDGGWNSSPPVQAPALATAAPAAAPPGAGAGPGAVAAPAPAPVAVANESGESPSVGAAYAYADRVLVLKSERVLRLMRRGQTLAEFPIRLGLNPSGHKQREGDFRTPEGYYRLIRRNPRSDFFLSIEVSYPGPDDLSRARGKGHRPGGLIMIHGQPNVPRKPADYYAHNDWTDGCIAVSNSDMVDIWLRTTLDTPIEIRP